MVIISDVARKILKSLDKTTRKKIGAEIRKFQEGSPVNIKKLKKMDISEKVIDFFRDNCFGG